jgi:hypothetical protein
MEVAWLRLPGLGLAVCRHGKFSRAAGVDSDWARAIALSEHSRERDVLLPQTACVLLRAELALGTLGAIEGQLWWLVVSQGSGEAIIGVGPPDGATLNTAENDGKA